MKNYMISSPYRIIKILKHTKAEYSFQVEFDGATSHGQFFMLSIPKIGEAPISVSGKGEGYVEFTIRRVGRLTDGVFALREGEMLFMRGPYGTSFPASDFRGKDLVVICGGTGIAPVKTLLNDFYENMGPEDKVYLIAGFKDQDAVLFTEELAKFKTKFNTIYTLDNDQAEGFETGMVTKHICKIPFKDMKDYNLVIVGPPIMMKFATLESIKEGATEEKIWVSFERKMSCAVGKCGHCKINETYVCLEGPVFPYVKAKDLLD